MEYDIYYFELMIAFESDMPLADFSRAPKQYWNRQLFYADKIINELFVAYLMGFELHNKRNRNGHR